MVRNRALGNLYRQLIVKCMRVEGCAPRLNLNLKAKQRSHRIGRTRIVTDIDTQRQLATRSTNPARNTRKVQQLNIVRTDNDQIRRVATTLTMDNLNSIYCRLFGECKGITCRPFDLSKRNKGTCPRISTIPLIFSPLDRRYIEVNLPHVVVHNVVICHCLKARRDVPLHPVNLWLLFYGTEQAIGMVAVLIRRDILTCSGGSQHLKLGIALGNLHTTHDKSMRVLMIQGRWGDRQSRLFHPIDEELYRSGIDLRAHTLHCNFHRFSTRIVATIVCRGLLLIRKLHSDNP